MIPNQLRCPSCGGEPRGTVESVPGCALLNFDESGRAEYAGETDIEWDGQTTDTTEDGRLLLLCDECCSTYPAPKGWQVE